MGVETAIIVGAVASVAGAGISAYGAYEQGQAQKSLAEYDAEVARVNAKNAENNADLLRQNNETALQETRRKHSLMKAQTEAAYASTGISMSGSPLIVMMDQAEQMEMDAQNQFISGENQATAIEYQATQLESQATVYDQKAKNANTMSYIGAGSSLLQGVGNASSIYVQGQK